VTGFQRPVSPNEWLYLAGARLAPPFAIQVVVEGQGRIEAGPLQRAVAVASSACPGARLVRRGRMWVDSGATPPVRAVGTLDGELRRPLDPVEGPTGEVLLVGDATLVFRAFHGVMDGRGALTWAAEVFRALRGDAVSGAASPLTDYRLLDQLGAVGKRASLPLDSHSPLYAGTPVGPGFHWLRRTLDGNHPGLVAKLAAAVAETCGQDRARFMVPVDLRRHSTSLASTANLSLPIFLDGRAGTPWTDWHQRLLRALTDKRELTSGTAERAAFRLPLRGLGAGLKAVDALSRRTDRHACTALLSHLGRVDLTTLSTAEFAATTVYSLPVHAPFAPVSFVATEPAGRTELAMSFSDGPGMAERASALLDHVCEALSPAAHRDWPGNSTARPYPAETTVVAQFRRQVAASPDAVALTGLDGDVTYAELDRRSNAVALAVASCGGGVVGLLADRSVAAMAGLWGILKAGAAYLPLDPANPDARISALLADAGATTCLASRRHAARVDGAVVLEDLPHSGQPVDESRPDDLAYVIYTSGSTGQPKGVQIEHRSLANYVTWATQLYRVDARTRFALFTSLAFDLTGTALFLPILAGGSIALVPDEVSPATLRHVLQGCGANTLKLTPAHLDLIGALDLTAIGPERPGAGVTGPERPGAGITGPERPGAGVTGFRTVVVGGEQLTTAVATRAQQAFGPGCRIVNEYGPTEATIGCIVHVFRPGFGGAAVPIGLPVDNTQAFMLDADRRTVAPGEPGELYLAGAQLARGYLGRPELDRERFVHLADGTRAYRTGDLARLLPSGVLEYLGRADDQLKIRGHRVEPGEVEAALLAHPAVARAAVVGRRRPGSRDTVLCAYVVAGCDEDELRRHLAARLPRYLVPSYLRCVDALPHTVNGKVDVRALPDLSAGVPGAAADLDPTEAAVAEIWSRILAVPVGQVEKDADFHQLGGDSLSMIEMIVAVGHTVVGPVGEDAFHAELATLVGEPTLARVCAAVATARGAVPA